MVEIVDLLDDSTDDEAEDRTMQSAVTCPASSSSCLRDVVANGYDTTPSTTSTRSAKFGSSKYNKCSATKHRTTNENSDDDVVWVPIPSVKTSIPNTRRKQPTETISGLSSQKKKAVKEYSSNFDNDSDGDSDSDIEVLEVNPKAAMSKTYQTEPTISSKKMSQIKPPTRSVPRPTLSDSDNDDDIFLMKPSGLTAKSQRLYAPPSGGSPIESRRKQLRTGFKTLQTGRIQNDSKPAASNTPKTSTHTHYSRISSSSKKEIHNPYAKTPQSTSNIAKGSSGKSLARSGSISSSSVDFGSVSSGKSRSIMKNPHESRPGKKRFNLSTASSSSGAGTSGLRAPKLRANTTTYRDIRPNIVLALWKFARKNLVRDSYQGIRLDQFIGRIVDLVVTARDFPIRSVGEYAIRKRGHMSKRGCGGLTSTGDALNIFEEDLNSTGMMNISLDPLVGKYFSISEACLVAMKEIVVMRWKANQPKQGRSQAFPADEASQLVLFSQKDHYVSLADLIPQIDRRLRPECPSMLERWRDSDKGVSYYLNKSTRSAEFKQVEKLLAPVEIPKADGSIESTSYIKKRLIRGKQHYQLLPLGFRKAVMISRRCLPAPSGPYRFCNLLSAQPKYDGICLGVDFREGGGGDRHRKVLHEMCNKLDLQKIPYFVSTLRIGDYCFFSGDMLCPIIVERKSVEDVAKSIDSGDGRWVKQKARMYHGQYVFGYQNCRMAYIIEGKIEKHLVSHNFIGNARHKVSRERFEEEVANLGGEGFDVLRTCSVENSMFEICRWAASVAKDVQSGRLKLEYTYNDFLEKIDAIPKNVDFSRLAKYHAKERKEWAVDLMSDNEKDFGYGGNLSPIVLDKRLQKAEKRKAREISTDNSSKASARKRFKLQECNKIEPWSRFLDSGSSSTALPAHDRNNTIQPSNEGMNEYSKWTASALRHKCVEFGMKKAGSKAELIERLMDPTNRPPPVYRLRQQRGLYIPAKLDTSSTAILVAIQIAQDNAAVGVENYVGATKDEIYVMADKIDIKKDPFCGGTTQTGPYRKYFDTNTFLIH